LLLLFTTGVNDTDGKFAAGVVDTGDTYTLTCEYLREISKKFEMTLVLFLGACVKMIHEKNLKHKMSGASPGTRRTEPLI
jgi:hypothetical protein